MATTSDAFIVPYDDSPVGARGTLSNVWVAFFRSLSDRLSPLGIEKSFRLVNNQSVAAPIDGMKVNARSTSQAIVEYLVQRITTGDDAVELLESGSFTLTFRPTDNDWDLNVLSEELPDDAGVEFIVGTDGQITYTTTDIAGEPSLSRIVWRMRTLGAKTTQYSSTGTRA